MRVSLAKMGQVYKPNSVFRQSRNGDHSSRLNVAVQFKRPTRRSYPDKSEFGRAALNASLFGLALRGVCLAAHVTMRAGALLH